MRVERLVQNIEKAAAITGGAATVLLASRSVSASVDLQNDQNYTVRTDILPGSPNSKAEFSALEALQASGLHIENIPTFYEQNEPVPVPSATITPTSIVNIRPEPNTATPQVGRVQVGIDYPVYGYSLESDGLWYYGEFPGVGNGWVNAGVVPPPQGEDANRLWDMTDVGNIQVAVSGQQEEQLLTDLGQQVNMVNIMRSFNSLKNQGIDANIFSSDRLRLTYFRGLGDDQDFIFSDNQTDLTIPVLFRPEGGITYAFTPQQVENFLIQQGVLATGELKFNPTKGLEGYLTLGDNVLLNYETEELIVFDTDIKDKTVIESTLVANGFIRFNSGEIYNIVFDEVSGIYKAIFVDVMPVYRGINTIESVANFDPTPQMRAENISVSVSREVLAQWGINNFSVPEELVRNAYDTVITRAFANTNTGRGIRGLSPIEFGDTVNLRVFAAEVYADQLNPRDDIMIRGTLRDAEIRVVTQSQYNNLLEQFRSNPNLPNHIVAYSNVAHTLVDNGFFFFDSDKLAFVVAATSTGYGIGYQVIHDTFAPFHLSLFESLSAGNGFGYIPPVEESPVAAIYRSFGCDESENWCKISSSFTIF